MPIPSIPPSPVRPVTRAETNPASRSRRRARCSNRSGATSRRTCKSCSFQSPATSSSSPLSSSEPVAPSVSVRARRAVRSARRYSRCRRSISASSAVRPTSVTAQTPRSLFARAPMPFRYVRAHARRYSIFVRGPSLWRIACCSSVNPSRSTTRSSTSSIVPEPPISFTAWSVGQSSSTTVGTWRGDIWDEYPAIADGGFKRILKRTRLNDHVTLGRASTGGRQEVPANAARNGSGCPVTSREASNS